MYVNLSAKVCIHHNFWIKSTNLLLCYSTSCNKTTRIKDKTTTPKKIHKEAVMSAYELLENIITFRKEGANFFFTIDLLTYTI